MTRSEIIYEKLLTLPIGAELVLEDCPEGAKEDTGEPDTEK
ncbi:hypothetical protein [Metabacillus litoralis]|nr:hypothetical protein [Metabacillus litoralis]